MPDGIILCAVPNIEQPEVHQVLGVTLFRKWSFLTVYGAMLLAGGMQWPWLATQESGWAVKTP